MKNVPGTVVKALRRRGADAILNQEGEYADFKPQIDRIIHGNEVPDRIDKSDYNEEYQEDLSPEEQKANDRIEELGDKYGMSGMTNEEKEIYEAHKDEIDAMQGSKSEKIANDIEEYVSKDSLNTIKRYCEKYDEDYNYVIGELANDIAAGALEDSTESEVVETLLDNLVAGNHEDISDDDEGLSPMEKSLFSYKPDKKLTDEDREYVKQAIADREANEDSKKQYNRGQTIDAPEKGEGWKKTKMASGILYEGPNGERYLDDEIPDYSHKSISELDKEGFYGNHNVVVNNLRNSVYETPESARRAMEDYKDWNDKQKAYVNAYINQVFGIDDNESNNNKPKNWYDNLSDDNEHARLYKEDAMKVNPERAALIAAAMDEYIAEKPQRGFITNDQMKRYGERLGLPQMSDRDLRLMWNDVNNVGGYRGFGTPYDKGGRELEDAQSAFAEVVNQEARNRKAKGNYFPYNDEDIEGGRDQIRKILSRLDGYDLDDARGYLTGDELDKIEGLAEQYHLTADDLAKISPHLDPNGMGYKMKGWEDTNKVDFDVESVNKIVEDTVKQYENDKNAFGGATPLEALKNTLKFHNEHPEVFKILSQDKYESQIKNIKAAINKLEKGN